MQFVGGGDILRPPKDRDRSAIVYNFSSSPAGAFADEGEGVQRSLAPANLDELQKNREDDPDRTCGQTI